MNKITNNNSLVSAIRFMLPPENRKEFFQTITPLIKKVRSETGCLNYCLFEETGDENSLLVIGEWNSEQSWAKHRDSDNCAVFHGLLHLLSIHSKTNTKLLLNANIGDSK